MGTRPVVGSAETVAHDDRLNSTVRLESGLSLPFARLQQRTPVASATVYEVQNATHARDPAAALHELSRRVVEKEAEAKAHYLDIESNSVRLHTPNREVNSAVAWAKNALDQAWVCKTAMLDVRNMHGISPAMA